MLPFGAKIKLAYVPNMTTGMNSAKVSATTTASQATGRTLTQGHISLAPIDGLTIVVLLLKLVMKQVHLDQTVKRLVFLHL